jgi:hypothetical protein
MKGQLQSLVTVALVAALTVLFVWQHPEQSASGISDEFRPSPIPPHLRHLTATPLGQDASVPEPNRTEPAMCTGGEVGTVVGLWIIDGNKKHHPGFYLNRLAIVVRRIARQGWNLTLVTNSADAAEVASSAFWRNAIIHTAMHVRRMNVSELPYAAQALAVDPRCPTKYGKALPRGALQTLDRLWLSKVWVLASTLRAAAAAARESGGCEPRSWAWFDAGLNSDEVQRATQSIGAAKTQMTAQEVRSNIQCKLFGRHSLSQIATLNARVCKKENQHLACKPTQTMIALSLTLLHPTGSPAALSQGHAQESLCLLWRKVLRGAHTQRQSNLGKRARHS